MPAGTDAAQVTTPGFRDPDFLRLCALVDDVRRRPRSPIRIGRSLLAGAREAAPMFRAWRRLPTLDIHVRVATPAGVKIAELLNERKWGVRTAVAATLLMLTDDADSFFSGRSRHAVRASYNRGRRRGIEIRSGFGPDQVRRYGREVLRYRSNPDDATWLLPRIDSGEGEYWFAFGPDGECAALAVLDVDFEVARLACMISAEREFSGEARHMLLRQAVTDLIHRRVRYIIADSALFLSPGLIQFQRIFGFEPTRVRMLEVAGSIRPPVVALNPVSRQRDMTS